MYSGYMTVKITAIKSLLGQTSELQIIDVGTLIPEVKVIKLLLCEFTAAAKQSGVSNLNKHFYPIIVCE